jgi:hypothetical protein
MRASNLKSAPAYKNPLQKKKYASFQITLLLAMQKIMRASNPLPKKNRLPKKCSLHAYQKKNAPNCNKQKSARLTVKSAPYKNTLPA